MLDFKNKIGESNTAATCFTAAADRKCYIPLFASLDFDLSNKWLIFVPTLAFVTLYNLYYFSLKLRFPACVHVISPFIHSYCLVHLNLLLFSNGENNRYGQSIAIQGAQKYTQYLDIEIGRLKNIKVNEIAYLQISNYIFAHFSFKKKTKMFGLFQRLSQ